MSSEDYKKQRKRTGWIVLVRISTVIFIGGIVNPSLSSSYVRVAEASKYAYVNPYHNNTIVQGGYRGFHIIFYSLITGFLGGRG